MAGRITLSHYGTIIACGVLFFIYIVFPAPFRLVSENLFLLVYTPVSVSESGAVSASVNREDTHIPLFVLARPPQTPYDFFITTAPEQPSVSDEKNVLFTLVEPSDSPIEYVYTEFGTPVGFVKRYNGRCLPHRSVQLSCQRGIVFRERVCYRRKGERQRLVLIAFADGYHRRCRHTDHPPENRKSRGEGADN